MSLSWAQIADDQGRRWNQRVEGKDKILAIYGLESNEEQTDKERTKSSDRPGRHGRSHREDETEPSTSLCRPDSLKGKTASAHAYVQSSFRWAILFFIPAPASWITGYALATKPALWINECTSSSKATTLASFRREWGTSVIANASFDHRTVRIQR